MTNATPLQHAVCRNLRCQALRIVLFTVAVLVICGCASRQPAGTAAGQPVIDTSGDAVHIEQAFHDTSRLWILYRAGGVTGQASASLAAAEELPAGGGQPARVLMPAARDTVDAAQAGATPVRVLPAPAWQALLDASLLAMAPAEDGYGAVVDILHEDELFLYRVRDDVLLSVPVVFKPPDVRVKHAYTFAELLDIMRQQLTSDYPAAGSLLFETGDNGIYGYPYVFADTGSGSILFLQNTPDTGYAGRGQLGSTLEVLTHTVTDHVRAFVNQPVTSVSRLFAVASSTTADLARPTPIALLENEPPAPLYQGAGMDLAQWEAELDRITGSPASAGHLRYRVGGREFFPRLIDSISAAGESVYLRVYIFDNDDYATQFADLLKRRSGDIDIRVLVDGLGTLGASMAESPTLPADHRPEASMIRYLGQDSRVHVRTVANVWLTGDHTKTILIDDRIAFLGGMNIGREYRYDWHDMMVEVEGPVVSEIASEFRRAWVASGPLGDLRQALHRDRMDRPPAGTADYPVRLLYTRPGDSEILRAQIAATRRARSHIFVESPYITSDAMLYELIKARHRGVDVRVIMPYRNDSGLIARSNVLAANTMLRNGIRVYIYPGMSHLKAALYDGWACLGSANLDRLSLRTNREMNLATSHVPAVEALRESVFVPDMERSVELTSPLPSNWSDYLAELLADYL